MSEPFEEDELLPEDEWVEISDIDGHKASLRHLATLHCDKKTYFVLGAVRQGDGDGGLMLVREDIIADGSREHVIVHSEQEIERVVGMFVRRAIESGMMHEDEREMLPDEVEHCGMHHLPWEFCYCDDPAYLQ